MLTDTMKSYYFTLLSLFVPLSSIYAQTSSHQELALVQNERIKYMDIQMHATPVHSPDLYETTDLGLHKGPTLAHHHQRHLRNMHGILILIGWGTLLPIGVIVARNCRKFPISCNEWHSFHIVCQTSGYFLGTIGWCIGLWLGSSSKQNASATQRTLSIVAFTFINVQMVSIFMRPKREEGYCKVWNIWHHVVGYAIIGIVIANILEGISSQSQARKLKWVYVGILGMLAFIAAALEIFRCIKSKIWLQTMQLTSSMYTTSP